MGFIDRILTIVITATVTSAVWIVAGGSIIENAASKRGSESVRPSEAAPSPTPAETMTDREENQETDTDDPLHKTQARLPQEVRVDKLIIPVMNVRASDLSDTFSDSRGGGNRLHEAIDIMAPEGTSVIAAAPGTVESLFYSEAGGNTIYVRSLDKLAIHYYAHLSEYAKGLKEGQKVRRGQRLGTVGSSGNASPDAPHLHFAMLRTTADAKWWEPANALNPYPLLTE